MRLTLAIALCVLPVTVATVQAQTRSAEPASVSGSCYDALERLGVDYERVRRKGIKHGVRVTGKLGGVDYVSYGKDRHLVLDCSLVYSLAAAGRFLRAEGIERVRYSSAYSRRNIRGTQRRSKHSFGLAIDVHTFETADEPLTVKNDYEQGLGDNLDCIGEPLTRAGRVLRSLSCQFVRSELFRIVLDPDYDADHYNHYHIEAQAWSERVQ